MRTRLRPKYSDDELAQIYATPHRHTQWADHVIRVDVTSSIVKWMFWQYNSSTAADLSAGDGAIIGSLLLPKLSEYIGDFAPGYEYTGPIEKTIDEIPPVDMFICSETIEHLDDPDMVLEKIATKAQSLVISTPIGEVEEIGNPEHYWGWDVKDVQEMLYTAGWEPVITTVITLPGWTYDYQIHGCRRYEA